MGPFFKQNKNNNNDRVIIMHMNTDMLFPVHPSLEGGGNNIVTIYMYIHPYPHLNYVAVLPHSMVLAAPGYAWAADCEGQM